MRQKPAITLHGKICDPQILAHAVAHNLSAHSGHPDTYVPNNPRTESRSCDKDRGIRAYREYYRSLRVDGGDISLVASDVM